MAALYLRHGSEETRQGAAFWRAARCYWIAGELLPLERRKERNTFYRTAAELASRGIEKDPECAECMLWNFTALGRIATTSSLVAGIRSAPRMAELLDRAIALNPTHRDGPNNSTLGNLHYGAAIFYRVLPDWVWLGWVIGALVVVCLAVSAHADVTPKRLSVTVPVGPYQITATQRGAEIAVEGGRVRHDR